MADAAQQQNSESSTQRGSKRIRQASSTTSPTAAAAAASRSGAGDNKQQQQQQQPCIAVEVQQLLQQAVQQLVQQGCLPQQGLPLVKVIAPAAKQLSKLPAGTLLTSSCAHALAAAARKLQRQGPGGTAGQQPASAAAAWGSADGLAELLAGAFNSRAAEAQLSQPMVASAAKGYLNFTAQQQQQQGTGQKQQQQQQTQQREQPSSSKQQHRSQQQPDSQRASQQHEAPAQLRQQQPQVPEQQQQQQQQGGSGEARQLKVVMVPSQFIQEEFELYCRYQVSLAPCGHPAAADAWVASGQR
jgi:hypothetical protein